MIIELEKICNENISQYSEYEKAYDTNIKNYQSRIFPSTEALILFWYHIKVDGKYIGATWLEKEASEDFPILGIFIVDEEYRNKGIGTEAIKQIINNDLMKMNTNNVLLRVRAENKRAISCYKKVGFIEKTRYVKNSVDVLEMIYTL